MKLKYIIFLRQVTYLLSVFNMLTGTICVILIYGTIGIFDKYTYAKMMMPAEMEHELYTKIIILGFMTLTTVILHKCYMKFISFLNTVILYKQKIRKAIRQQIQTQTVTTEQTILQNRSQSISVQ